MASINRILLILGLVAILSLQAGCEKKSSSVDQKFVNTYTELLVIEQMYGKDSPTARVNRKTRLSDSGYTRESFLQEANKVLDNKDMWVPFQKAVIERLDSLIAQGEKQRKSSKRQRGED